MSAVTSLNLAKLPFQFGAFIFAETSSNIAAVEASQLTTGLLSWPANNRPRNAFEGKKRSLNDSERVHGEHQGQARRAEDARYGTEARPRRFLHRLYSRFVGEIINLDQLQISVSGFQKRHRLLALWRAAGSARGAQSLRTSSRRRARLAGPELAGKAQNGSVDLPATRCQYRIMLGETQKQFSLTRAASITYGRANSKFSSVYVGQ